MKSATVLGIDKRLKYARNEVYIHRIAKLLNLYPYVKNVPMLGTDIDLLGIKNGIDIEVVAVEIKVALHPGNISKAIAQLDFRAKFFDRVYIAVPPADVWYAIAMIPLDYGVVEISSNPTLHRDSKKFVGVYQPLMRSYLMRAYGGGW